jgi:hypothetical protein
LRPRVSCAVGAAPVALWLLVELRLGGAALVQGSLSSELGEAATRLGDFLGKLFPALAPGGHEALVATFPALLVSWALLLAVGVYRLAELGLPQVGLKVPRTSSFSSFSLPWSATWVAIAGLAMSLWAPGPAGVVGVNMAILAALAYSFQGASVLSFWLSKAASSPLRTILVLGAWSLAAHLLAVVGFVDCWYDLRGFRRSRGRAG